MSIKSERKNRIDLLLIQPPELSKLSHGSLEQFSNIDIGKYPPLGLMYITAFIKKHSDFKVEVLDAVCESLNFEEIKKIISNIMPKFVGIYTTSFTIVDSYKTAKVIKEVSKDIKVIFGGPHIDIFPEETIRLPGIDFIVIGEGEQTTLELLLALKNRKKLSNIKSIGYKDKNNIYITERRPLIKNLDDIPFPAREHTRYNRYNSLIGEDEIATTIMSSRGCPNKCAFCYVPYMGTLRLRSPKNVLDEIEKCLSIGIREFFFFDENFTISKKHVIDFCDGIKKRGLNIKFFIRSRINTLDEEMVYKLKEAECKRIQFGVESGSQKILDSMNKNIKIDQIKETFNIVKNLGISTYADFMIGYPGETIEDIEKTFDLCLKINSDYVQFGITMLMPNTKIYSDALKKEFLKEDFWRILATQPDEKATVPLASEIFTKEELELLQRQAYLKFYFRPKYIVKRLLRVKNLNGFKKQLKAGIALLKLAPR